MPRFLSAQPDTRLITLPWATPLEDWPTEHLVALPRGISRHVVRFVRVGPKVYAIKEVLEHLALHEYRLLRDLTRLDTPSVEAVGVVTDRLDADGEPLDPILITRAPAVLAAVPLAVQPRRPPGHGQPAGRRDGRAAGPAAPDRLPLGRRVAVQHAVPPRRRRLRRLPGRRRDRRAARPADQRAARARPDHRPDQPVRRVLRPGGRRPAGRGAGPAGAGRDHREPLPRAVGRADRRRGVRHRRDAPDRVPGPSAQRPRASTSPSSTSPPTSPARPSGSSPRSSTPVTTRAG